MEEEEALRRRWRGGRERERERETERERIAGNGRARCSRIGAPVCTMCAESPC